MTVNEIIALARAGFSAENISALAAAQAQQPVQQIQPVQPVQQIQNQHDQIRNDVLGLLRGYNVGNFQQPVQETADDILAHIIAPEPPKQEGVGK